MIAVILACSLSACKKDPEINFHLVVKPWEPLTISVILRMILLAKTHKKTHEQIEVVLKRRESENVHLH